MVVVHTPIDFSRIKLLIFDLDGTLIDSKQDLVASSNHTRSVVGLPPLDASIISSYVGDGARTLIQRLLDDSTDEARIDQALEIFLKYYRAHMLDHTGLYPGVREALEQLAAGRIGAAPIMTVLTNKPVRFSRMILDGLDAARYFRFIYGGNSFETKKPDPLGANTIMDEVRISPGQTLMIGDSAVDVLTGRNAGISTCGVTYGLGSERLKEVPVDVLIDDLRELVDMLHGESFATPIENERGEMGSVSSH